MVIGWVKPKTFDEFRKELYKPRPVVSKKTAAEIESEMLAIVSAYEGR